MTELPATPPFSLAKVEPILLRAKIDTPVITSFGTIPERAVLLVRLEDKDGAVGWGEIFGNFPMHGAENRAHLVRDYIARSRCRKNGNHRRTPSKRCLEKHTS